MVSKSFLVTLGGTGQHLRGGGRIKYNTASFFSSPIRAKPLVFASSLFPFYNTSLPDLFLPLLSSVSRRTPFLSSFLSYLSPFQSVQWVCSPSLWAPFGRRSLRPTTSLVRFMSEINPVNTFSSPVKPLLFLQNPFQGAYAVFSLSLWVSSGRGSDLFPE